MPLYKGPMTPFKDQQVAIDKLYAEPSRLVGDSMGVGKTVTGLGLDFKTRETRPDLKDKPTLIIPEKIGIDVWSYHLHEMGVPDREVFSIDPKDREPFVALLENFKGRNGTAKNRDVLFPDTGIRYVICHWDALIRVEELTGKPGNLPKHVQWAHVIADEVHLAKNRKAMRTKALKRIQTHYKTGLSGTPADDKPDDLWSVLNWLYPKQFRSYWRFYNQYIEWESVPPYGYHRMIGVKNIPHLHKEIGRFYIRRTLLEVAPDMPEKIHVRPITMVEMTKAQRKTYESMRDKMIAQIGGDPGNGEGAFTLVASIPIAMYTRLQQFALGTLLPEWEVPDDDWVDNDDWDFPNIVISEPSAKLDAVMNIIETHEDEPFVVFTQFRGMADLVEERCQREKIPVVKITGDITSKDKRTESVRAFQGGKARVFVGTIAAAGKTITLDRACHAIFIDRSWNPSKNEQAEDRIWRRTQKNTVRIIDIQAEDSIDQVRITRIDEKALWIHQLLNPEVEKRQGIS